MTDALWTQTAREQPRISSTIVYIGSRPTCRYAAQRDQPRLRPTPYRVLENHCGGNVTVGSNPTPSALTSENLF